MHLSVLVSIISTLYSLASLKFDYLLSRLHLFPLTAHIEFNYFYHTLEVFDSPGSLPITRYLVFLLTFCITFPPYCSTKDLASSRSIDSRTPVITNDKPSKQFSPPL